MCEGQIGNAVGAIDGGLSGWLCLLPDGTSSHCLVRQRMSAIWYSSSQKRIKLQCGTHLQAGKHPLLVACEARQTSSASLLLLRGQAHCRRDGTLAQLRITSEKMLTNRSTRHRCLQQLHVVAERQHRNTTLDKF
jgi:hypothetical protein